MIKFYSTVKKLTKSAADKQRDIVETITAHERSMNDRAVLRYRTKENLTGNHQIIGYSYVPFGVTFTTLDSYGTNFILTKVDHFTASILEGVTVDMKPDQEVVWLRN